MSQHPFITIFTTPKAFRDHLAIIQRNAIRSWTLLPAVGEIMLLGDSEGTAAVAQEFGVRHIPQVACNEYGTPLLNSLFESAQAAASFPVLAYVNADIILLDDFAAAVQRISPPRFLMVGQRWDLDLNRPWDFTSPEWEARLHAYLAEHGNLHGATGIDYFVFPAGLWASIPPFAIGRTSWDNWLIYRARARGAAVVDATQAITAIHQNHDYSHVPGGSEKVWKGVEAQHNLELAGGQSRCFTLQDATHVLTPRGLESTLDREHLLRHLSATSILHPRLHWPVRLLSRALRLLIRPASV